jgi:hypothetical protein
MGLSEFEVITSEGAIARIKADYAEIIDGLLELRDSGELVCAFPRGQWLALERKKK